LGFIDRFLISTETFRIPTWLIFNKADLLDKKALAYQESVMQVYQNIGYRCLTTSTKTQEGIIDFKKQLLNQQTLIAGHSGVGKSSLINLVLPHLSLKTSEISNFSGKGVHTTTFAEMFDIDESSRLIDTPGIRELGIVDIAPEELSHYFPEMRALLGKCKYNTCTHLHEPNCAVLEALARGEIAESRYETYLTIMEGRDTRAKRK
jgi:ribosome biogenesis GTPase